MGAQRRTRILGGRLVTFGLFQTGVLWTSASACEICLLPLSVCNSWPAAEFSSRHCWHCRYWNVLRAAAGQVASAQESNNNLPLVLNLGPTWGNSEVYLLFGNNTIEIPFKDWESPPGLGICPLGVIFTVCSSVSSWLALNPDNVVVRPAVCSPQEACCLLSSALQHWGSVAATRCSTP